MVYPGAFIKSIVPRSTIHDKNYLHSGSSVPELYSKWESAQNEGANEKVYPLQRTNIYELICCALSHVKHGIYSFHAHCSPSW